ncbi:MAG TPA: hypothetical protein VL096_09100 [Pirellulaceae bacterium]|nr:hypothetical protein [Pirellulaceae bacterium]
MVVALVLVVGLLLSAVSAIYVADRFPGGIWLKAIGWAALVVGGYVVLLLAYQMSLPRLAFDGANLLVYLQSSQPIAVPIEIVELFFMGQGDSYLPVASDGMTKSRTVVVRLALDAPQWHNLPLKSAFGEWRDAYILLRGTWCEPLTPAVIKRLNQTLAEVRRQQRPVEDSPA